MTTTTRSAATDYTFTSEGVTEALMGLGMSYDPTDLCEEISRLLAEAGQGLIYISAPDDDDVCPITAPRNLSPDQVENLIGQALRAVLAGKA